MLDTGCVIIIVIAILIIVIFIIMIIIIIIATGIIDIKVYLSQTNNVSISSLQILYEIIEAINPIDAKIENSIHLKLAIVMSHRLLRWFHFIYHFWNLCWSFVMGIKRMCKRNKIIKWNSNAGSMNKFYVFSIKDWI